MAVRCVSRDDSSVENGFYIKLLTQTGAFSSAFTALTSRQIQSRSATSAPRFSRIFGAAYLKYKRSDVVRNAAAPASQVASDGASVDLESEVVSE